MAEIFDKHNTKSRGRQQYLTPGELKQEYLTSIEKGKPTDKLVKMFEKIAKKYSNRLTFTNKCDLDACINWAVTEAWIKWNKYDEERSPNIFAFFTQMIKNDLMQHSQNINKGKDITISIDALYTEKD